MEKAKAEKEKAKAEKAKAKAEKAGQFIFLPIQEATNNLDYYRLLLVNHFNLNPITCYLKPVNYGGDVKTTWNKETVQAYKVSFSQAQDAIECIAVNQTDKVSPDLTMVRLLTDFPFDFISHVLTYTQRTKGIDPIKWVIFKPLEEGSYRASKANTAKRYTEKYNKVFAINK